MLKKALWISDCIMKINNSKKLLFKLLEWQMQNKSANQEAPEDPEDINELQIFKEKYRKLSKIIDFDKFLPTQIAAMNNSPVILSAIKYIEKTMPEPEFYDDSADYYSAQGINAVLYGDEIYPAGFYQINDPPLTLYYIGNKFEKITKLTPKISIVGSRYPTSYGISITKKISETISEYSCPIISGMAIGIDSIAHQIALINNTPTIAILANGVDICYPKQNRHIYEKIKIDGAVISEYPPSTKPLKYYFPLRNRLISALSDIVIITEANHKSGSLHTAGYAAEQNKSVFTVPGNIFSPNSTGCNRLLLDGASPLIDLQIIKDYLEIKVDIRKNIEISTFNLEANETLLNLDDQAKKLIMELAANERSAEELSLILRRPLDEILLELTNYQLKGLIFLHCGRYAVKDIVLQSLKSLT